jgi:hypothetical protein
MRFCPFCSAENADEIAVCQSCGRRLPPLPPRRARNAPASGVLLPPRPASTTQPPPVTARRAGTTNPPPTGPTSSGAASPPSSVATQPGAAIPPPRVTPLPTAAGATPANATAAPSSVMATAAGFAPVVPSPSGMRAPAAAPATGLPSIPRGASPPAPPAEPSGSPPPAIPLHGSIRETAAGLPPPPPAAPDVPGAPGPASPAFRDEGARALAHALSPGPAAQRREAPPPSPAELGSPARRRGDVATSPAAAPPAPRLPSVLPGGPRAPATGQPAPASPHATVDPPWATSQPRAAGAGRDAASSSSGSSGLSAASPGSPAFPASNDSVLAIEPARRRDDGIEPPPTRIHRPEALVDRPFTPPKVSAVPEIPEPGLINSARYTVRFARARWQRRGAIKMLGVDIKKDTDALDQVLGALGGVARTAKVEGRVFSGENAAITGAEDRVAQLTREHNDVDARKLEENSKFVDVERERNTKLGEAERMVDEVQKELAQLDAQRRALRDRRKDLERRQKAAIKAAEDADRQAGGVELGDSRQELRRGAEQHRREAAALEPERQDIDRRLAGLERPIGEATAKLDAAKAELDAAKRSLADAREGHTHRLAELDAEQKRKAREIAQAEAEIARRLVTLGTLVNLNRIDDPQFAELYDRIDRLRGAITARTTEIEKLTAERETYDRGNIVRGLATIGGAILLFIALIVILRAVLR